MVHPEKTAVLAIYITILVASGLCQQPRKTETYAGNQVLAQSVMVKFRRSLPASIVRSIASGEDADTVTPVGSTGAVLLHSRSKSVSALLTDLRHNDGVLYAEPDAVLHIAAVPNDPYLPEKWGIQNNGQVIAGQVGIAGDDSHATSAWDISTGGTKYSIAVVDTGVNYSHEDLSANMWSSSGSFQITVGGVVFSCPAGTHGINIISGSCDPTDDNNHGTAVAGIAAAQGNNGVGVVGVNWQASVVAIKALDSTGSATEDQLINGIDAAVQLKSIGVPIGVISMSVAQSVNFNQTFSDEIDKAGNMLFVTAAGNFGVNNDTTSVYPADFDRPNQITVAATDNVDNRAVYNSTESSDWGATTVHLAAPGWNGYSTMISGYGGFSGTSMAAPFVSGAAALVLSACPLDTSSLKSTILNNVDQVTSMGSITITGGRLDVDKAIRSCYYGTPSTGTVSISGPNTGNLCGRYPDRGTVSVTIDSQYVYSVNYNNQMNTAAQLAQALASAINGDQYGLASATVTSVDSYDATIHVTTRAKGPTTAWPMSAKVVDSSQSCQPDFSASSTALSGGGN